MGLGWPSPAISRYAMPVGAMLVHLFEETPSRNDVGVEQASSCVSPFRPRTNPTCEPLGKSGTHVANLSG